MLEQRDRGAAVVMSTHDMEDAQVLCDRILLIDNGRRLLYGSVADVRRAFSDGAVEVVGKHLPTDVDGMRSASHATVPLTARCATCCVTASRRRTCSANWAMADAEVERFAVEAPNLAEIFIRAVAGDERARSVA